MMPIHCAAALESSEVTKAAFGGKNCRGGPWLPREIEISLLERTDGKVGVDDAEVTYGSTPMRDGCARSAGKIVS